MSVLLNLENVSFGWDENIDLLNIPSFSIRKGEHCFVMGPSGCGKSTMLSLLGGIITPRQGKVMLNGVDIAKQKSTARDKTRANNIGFVFQQFNLVPYLNAYENVLLPTQFSRQRAENAVHHSGSPIEEAMKLLDGFFTNNKPQFDQAVAKLSVGQQQRVAAARALIGSPSLIIADEPTSALDHDSRLRFMSLLLDQTERQESTLLFVSHDPTLAEYFDCVMDMSEINKKASG